MLGASLIWPIITGGYLVIYPFTTGYANFKYPALIHYCGYEIFLEFFLKNCERS